MTVVFVLVSYEPNNETKLHKATTVITEANRWMATWGNYVWRFDLDGGEPTMLNPEPFRDTEVVPD